MAASSNNIAIIYIDKSRFDYYSLGSPTALSLIFPLDTVKDLEIINPPSLNTQIKSFMDQNKITPTPLIIILSENIIFSEDFPQGQVEQQKTEIQKFLDTIPFEKVNSKVFKLEKGTKVVATNQEYYDTIQKAFEKLGSITLAVIPALVLGNINTQNGLDTPTLQSIIEKFELFKQYSLLIPQNSSGKNQEGKTSSLLSPKNLRLTILLALFLILILILFALVFLTLLKKPQPPKPSVVSPTLSPVQTLNPTLPIVPFETKPPSTTSALPLNTP